MVAGANKRMLYLGHGTHQRLSLRFHHLHRYIFWCSAFLNNHNETISPVPQSTWLCPSIIRLLKSQSVWAKKNTQEEDRFSEIIILFKYFRQYQKVVTVTRLAHKVTLALRPIMTYCASPNLIIPDSSIQALWKLPADSEVAAKYENLARKGWWVLPTKFLFSYS